MKRKGLLLAAHAAEGGHLRLAAQEIDRAEGGGSAVARSTLKARRASSACEAK